VSISVMHAFTEAPLDDVVVGSADVVVLLDDIVVGPDVVVVDPGKVVVGDPGNEVVDVWEIVEVVEPLVVGDSFITVVVDVGGGEGAATGAVVVGDSSPPLEAATAPVTPAAPAAATAAVPAPIPPPTLELTPTEDMKPAMPAAWKPGGIAAAPASVAPTTIPGFCPGNTAPAGSRSHWSETTGSYSAVRAP
jgi:hypothetical protein